MEDNVYMSVFNGVRSALSGNGKLPVNRLIKRYKRPFHDYTISEWYDIWNDYTSSLLTGDVNGEIPYHDCYDPELSSLQTWINYKVLDFIQHRARAWNREKNDSNNNIEPLSLTGYEEYFVSNTPDPESLVIIKETYMEIIRLERYISAYTGEKTYDELAEELGIHRNTVYNNVKKLNSEIKDLEGYLR